METKENVAVHMKMQIGDFASSVTCCSIKVTFLSLQLGSNNNLVVCGRVIVTIELDFRSQKKMPITNKRIERRIGKSLATKINKISITTTAFSYQQKSEPELVDIFLTKPRHPDQDIHNNYRFQSPADVGAGVG